MDMDRFFQRLADCLMSGDLATAATCYAHPLVVYAPEGIRIEKTPEDTMQILAERFLCARSGGATRAVTRLDSMEQLQNNRRSFDVTWTFLDEDEQPVGTSQFRYFCREFDGTPKIELLDIIQIYRLNAMPLAGAISH